MGQGAQAITSGAASSSLQVATLTDDTMAAWDAFVHDCPEASFFHLSGWQTVIERSFAHDTYYLYAFDAAGIRGVLPMGHVESRLFGNALISVPFCVYGGIAAADDAARRELEEAACTLAERLGVDYLEMRNLQPRRPDWPGKALYVTFRKQIDSDSDANLKAIPKKQRAMVRKGIKNGLSSALSGEADLLYDVYAESVRNLGTPVFSRCYFHNLLEVFGESCELLCIHKDQRLIASVMSFYFRDEILPYYGGGTLEARALRANDFMYWELMRRAGDNGVRVFDFGRSKEGSGSYRFKKHWGFEPTPLYYEYYLVRAEEMPNLSPTNPRYRLMISLWRRMPVALSKLIGPMIARYLA